jgi:hypothetical protein
MLAAPLSFTKPKTSPLAAQKKAAVRPKHSSKTIPAWLSDKKTNTEHRNKEKMNQLAAKATIELHLVRKAG